MTTVLAMSGSRRAGSLNTTARRAAMTQAPEGVEMQLLYGRAQDARALRQGGWTGETVRKSLGIVAARVFNEMNLATNEMNLATGGAEAKFDGNCVRRAQDLADQLTGVVGQPDDHHRALRG